MSATKEILIDKMNEDIEKYPQIVLDMLNIEGFQKKFLDFQGDYRTYEQAYDATERFYKRHFGQEKYSSYKSFRKCMKDYLKKKAKNNGIQNKANR